MLELQTPEASQTLKTELGPSVFTMMMVCMLRLVIYLNEDEEVPHSSQIRLGRRATRER